ncbi:MAG: radical SAM protein [Pseudomonadales bacterium]
MNIAITRENLLAQTRTRMANLFTPNQVLGRIQTIGCVAVEITQRCNLDCTLCYLSEHSQSVRDIPISEVFKRLDAIVTHYGVGTHVQITGGDPTLRKHTELIEIVRYARDIGLYPAMFTNGIAASRPLLEKLAAVGLCDLALHVDTTQRRAGYDSETALNEIRKEYIERARGLGLMVIFNTTVHKGNFEELPQLVQFFSDNADVVSFTSFQLQADTGRGEWGSRAAVINQQTVRAQLEAGAGKPLPWGVVQVGHGDCHSYMPTLIVNGNVYPVVDDAEFLGGLLNDFKSVTVDRHSPLYEIVMSYTWAALKQPAWWPRLLSYAFSQLCRMWKDLLLDRGRIRKLSFFVQNFMDAGHLDHERIGACSFMVMTAEGPVSMCEHNARRDEFILKPIDITKDDGSVERFEPLKWRGQKRAAQSMSS